MPDEPASDAAQLKAREGQEEAGPAIRAVSSPLRTVAVFLLLATLGMAGWVLFRYGPLDTSPSAGTPPTPWLRRP